MLNFPASCGILLPYRDMHWADGGTLETDEMQIFRNAAKTAWFVVDTTRVDEYNRPDLLQIFRTKREAQAWLAAHA